MKTNIDQKYQNVLNEYFKQFDISRENSKINSDNYNYISSYYNIVADNHANDKYDYQQVNYVNKDVINKLLLNAPYKLISNISTTNQQMYIDTVISNSKQFYNILNKNIFNFNYNGKQYNNEKAIISLTSWKARIEYVGITLYNLLSMCPDFHVVLVLSSDEFPKKENELPIDIKLLLHYKLIEILWVKQNYKAFKKVIFTLDKYKQVPVISADDDCIYVYNYAEKYYQEWEKDKDCFVTGWSALHKNIFNPNEEVYHTAGCGTLYPPYVFKSLGIKCLSDKILESNQDDDYYTGLKMLLGLNKCKTIKQKTWLFHDTVCPLSGELLKMNTNWRQDLRKIIYKEFIKIKNKKDKRRILVSMTSYPERIPNISKSIQLLFEKQVLPPDQIHLWLSTEEFPNKEKSLPEELISAKKQYKNKLLIHWLKKNTFVHKRHEIFKITKDTDYVFLIDDDVEYNPELIKTVMDYAEMYEDTIILYNGYDKHIYNGKHIIYHNPFLNIQKPEVNKFRWCGQSMIPSKVYPKEILSEENQEIRNNTSPISDECWFQPWVVYYDIPLYHCRFGWGKDIDKKLGKNTGLVAWTHQKDPNGYEKRDNWLNAVLKAYPFIYKKYNKLFNYTDKDIIV